MRHNFAAALLFVVIAAAVSSPGQKSAVPKKPGVEQDLIRTEIGFFEAWKTQDEAYFRSHVAEDGVFWGEDGTLSREEQLREQKMSAAVCTVRGYNLSDFGVMPLSAGTYLLTYKAEQYGTCSGSALPVHLNGSSVYVLREGRWLAAYRAQIAMKGQD